MTGSAAALVLVADDDPDVLALVALTLERAGHEVIRARDGEEAVRLALARRPAVAVLDVAMPALDGYEVTRRLRETPTTRTLPVLLLTARVQEGDVARGVAAGADDYVQKPFSPLHLVARVGALLRYAPAAGGLGGR